MHFICGRNAGPKQPSRSQLSTLSDSPTPIPVKLWDSRFQAYQVRVCWRAAHNNEVVFSKRAIDTIKLTVEHDPRIKIAGNVEKGLTSADCLANNSGPAYTPQVLSTIFNLCRGIVKRKAEFFAKQPLPIPRVMTTLTQPSLSRLPYLALPLGSNALHCGRFEFLTSLSCRRGGWSLLQ